ncbi:MAG: GTP-binding protein [Candidatus Thorarchaeota archaeon]
MRLFKILLCGDAAVGKTSTRHRYFRGSFTSEYISTIGADFATTEIPLSSGDTAKFAVWDIAGQQIFEHMRPAFYNGAAGAFVLYDVTRRESYENIRNWVSELATFHSGLEYFPIVILANKTDLREKVAKSVTTAEGKELAKKLSSEYYSDTWRVPFLETSAKTGDNVEKAFLTLADAVAALQEALHAQRLKDAKKARQL